jgi:hypothetical protein
VIRTGTIDAIACDEPPPAVAESTTISPRCDFLDIRMYQYAYVGSIDMDRDIDINSRTG